MPLILGQHLSLLFQALNACIALQQLVFPLRCSPLHHRKIVLQRRGLLGTVPQLLLGLSKLRRQVITLACHARQLIGLGIAVGLCFVEEGLALCELCTVRLQCCRLCL